MDVPTGAFEERKRHGSALFPLNLYPCTIPKDFPSVPLHWQESMELIFIKKGSGVCLAGAEALPAGPGDVFILPPGRPHGLRGLPGHVMEYENLIFELEFLGAGAADVCARRYLVPLAAGQLALPARLAPGDAGYEPAAACLREIETLCGARGPGYELGVKAALLRFLFLLLQGGAEALPAEPADTARLRTVLSLVDAGPSQPLSVAAAAAACGCSPSHFMRWFKKVTGTTFTAYLNERRLAAAAEALRRTDDTILAVAENAGFANLSNFNRQFRARYHTTPRAWRQGG